MANEITAPIIDMEQVQKAANEAATKAVLKEVEEYYNGYNSPFRKQVRQYLEQNVPSAHLELPQFSEMLMRSIANEVDKYVHQNILGDILKDVSRVLTRIPLDEDGSVKLSALFKQMKEGMDLEDYDGEEKSISLEVTEDPDYHWQRALLTITEGDDETKYEFTLHKMYGTKESDGLFQILGMPYKENQGLWARKIVVQMDGAKVEIPTFSGVLDSPILLTLARCIMFKTPIRIDRRDMYESNMDD